MHGAVQIWVAANIYEKVSAEKFHPVLAQYPKLRAAIEANLELNQKISKRCLNVYPFESVKCLNAIYTLRSVLQNIRTRPNYVA